jgi:hypothetical protein
MFAAKLQLSLKNSLRPPLCWATTLRASTRGGNTWARWRKHRTCADAATYKYKFKYTYKYKCEDMKWYFAVCSSALIAKASGLFSQHAWHVVRLKRALSDSQRTRHVGKNKTGRRGMALMFRNVIGVLLQHIDWPGTWRLHSKFVAQTHTGRKEEKSPWATEVGIVS